MACTNFLFTLILTLLFCIEPLLKTHAHQLMPSNHSTYDRFAPSSAFRPKRPQLLSTSSQNGRQILSVLQTFSLPNQKFPISGQNLKSFPVVAAGLPQQPNYQISNFPVYQTQQQQQFLAGQSFPTSNVGAATQQQSFAVNSNSLQQQQPQLQLQPVQGQSQTAVQTASETGTFDPALAGGTFGLPGIKFRINPSGFEYLSRLGYRLINRLIASSRLPEIHQCLPQADGCINVYSLHITNFRLPTNIHIYPGPPNLIHLDVLDFDISISGELNGKITIIEGIALFGNVNVQLNRVNARLSIVLAISPDHSLEAQLVNCRVNIGQGDLFITNGGTVGNLVNTSLRRKVSNYLRRRLGRQICGRIPSVLNERINPRLRQSIPKTIPITTMVQLLQEHFDLNSLLGSAEGQAVMASGVKTCPSTCKAKKAIKSSKLKAAIVAAAPLRHSLSSRNLVAPPPNGRIESLRAQSPRLATSNSLERVNRSESKNHPRQHRRISSAIVAQKGRSVRNSQHTAHFGQQQRSRMFASNTQKIALIEAGSENDPCKNCSGGGGSTSSGGTAQAISHVLRTLDMRKLEGIYLNTELLGTHANQDEYIVDLNGQVSSRAGGAVPFAPFPMEFNEHPGRRMVDLLISDFTINSLLFQLHRVGFIHIKIDPETPQIGKLLQTTCGDEDLEDTGVELDESVFRRRKRHLLPKRQAGNDTQTTDVSETETSTDADEAETSTDVGVSTASSTNEETTTAVATESDSEGSDSTDSGDETSSLLEGVCLSTVLPAFSRWPKQQVEIEVYSAERAPAVILSRKNGGTVTLKAVLNADFFIRSTHEKAGTLRIDTTLDIKLTSQGRHLAGQAKLTELKLREVGGKKLGVEQDALDNLANTAQVLIEANINKMIGKGIDVKIPPQRAGAQALPIEIIDPEVSVVEHGIVLSADIEVPDRTLDNLLAEGF